jgi:two-component sensor histidine kinase
VALVLTELVTNAVEHARTPLTVTVGLLLTSANAGAGDENGSGGARALVLRIEVTDGSTLPPRPHPLNPRAARGRGLQMVEALTTGWGHTLTATGKTVWAELAPGTLSVPSPP